MGAGRVPRELHARELAPHESHHGTLQQLPHERQARRDVHGVRSQHLLGRARNPGLQLLSLLAGDRHGDDRQLAWSIRGSPYRDIDELGLRFPDFTYRHLRASWPKHLHKL